LIEEEPCPLGSTALALGGEEPYLYKPISREVRYVRKNKSTGRYANRFVLCFGHTRFCISANWPATIWALDWLFRISFGAAISLFTPNSTTIAAIPSLLHPDWSNGGMVNRGIIVGLHL
jgi:hypothetical protein